MWESRRKEQGRPQVQTVKVKYSRKISKRHSKPGHWKAGSEHTGDILVGKRPLLGGDNMAGSGKKSCLDWSDIRKKLTEAENKLSCTRTMLQSQSINSQGSRRQFSEGPVTKRKSQKGRPNQYKAKKKDKLLHQGGGGSEHRGATGTRRELLELRLGTKKPDTAQRTEQKPAWEGWGILEKEKGREEGRDAH